MPLSAKSTVTHVLLTLAAVLVILLIAWMALQLPVAQLERFTALRAQTPYFAIWRTLLYTLFLVGWTVALRRQRTVTDQQRLRRLGLVGFTSIILVELSRV